MTKTVRGVLHAGVDREDVMIQVLTWKRYLPWCNGWENVTTMASRLYKVEHEILALQAKMEDLLQKHVQASKDLNRYVAGTKASLHYGELEPETMENKAFKALPSYCTTPEDNWRGFFNPSIIRKYKLSNEQQTSNTPQKPDPGKTLYSVKGAPDEAIAAVMKQTGAATSVEYKTPQPKEGNKSGKKKGGDVQPTHRNRRPNEENADFQDRKKQMIADGTW